MTNLIGFSDKVTSAVDKGRAVDAVHLDFSRYHSVLIIKSLR